MNEWQTIETAPKGTNILGWGEHIGIRTIDFDDKGNPWSDEGQHPVSAFTHWMHLPEPPTPDPDHGASSGREG